MSEANCPICLSPPDDPVNLCVDCHEPLCKNCMASYMESTLRSAYMGTCPVIACPSSTHHKTKRRRIIAFIKWKHVMPAELSTKYSTLASSLLAFLCGGCHSLKSLDLGHESRSSATCYENISRTLTVNGESRLSQFEDALQNYSIGALTVEELYELICEVLFPQLGSLSDGDAWTIFSDILKTIPDPERRANLHLRYLRDRPRIRTLCCNREHCFRCKVKDFHDGKTCMENIESLDHSIVHCPTCGIALAKGDGCNTVTCVCGKQFSWSAEKENTERCQQFLAAYPMNTTKKCVDLLCSSITASQMSLARAWQTRHRVAVNQALKELFKTTYWPCPSQCVTVLPFETMPDGWREAAELWRADKNVEVEKCREQNNFALRSIFLTMYPNPATRPAAAQQIITASRKGSGLTVNPRLVQSANMWIGSNKKEYIKGIEALEERSARQFLYLFGRKSIKYLKPAFSSSACSLEWNRDISNSDLTYTNGNTTVERVGSVSCYPAAFSNLVAERATFRIVIDTAPRTSNWLTFGVARRGMASSSSDGVGRTSNTWGLSDDRSSSSSSTIIAASGREVAQFRKLKAGDILAAKIDTAEGWCELSINETEFIYRFEGLPIGTRDDYWFAMSFANDHRVSILPEISPTTKSDGGSGDLLNPEHTVMYCNLKKILKKLMTDPDLDPGHSHSDELPSLTTGESEWITHCGGDDRAAVQIFDELHAGIETLLNMPRKEAASTNIERSLEMVMEMNFQALLYAVSWFRHNRDRLRETLKIETAMNFKMIHGDDAAFIAAITLMEYHSTKAAKDEQQSALAYMHIFADEMNDWYDYDANSRDSVIEGVARGCRCLPRHISSCPYRNGRSQSTSSQK